MFTYTLYSNIWMPSVRFFWGGGGGGWGVVYIYLEEKQFLIGIIEYFLCMNFQMTGNKLAHFNQLHVNKHITIIYDTNQCHRGVATLGSTRHVPSHNFNKILRKICIK